MSLTSILREIEMAHSYTCIVLDGDTGQELNRRTKECPDYWTWPRVLEEVNRWNVLNEFLPRKDPLGNSIKRFIYIAHREHWE